MPEWSKRYLAKQSGHIIKKWQMSKTFKPVLCSVAWTWGTQNEKADSHNLLIKLPAVLYLHEFKWDQM